MVYNAEGQHFIPLVAHKGDVVNAVQKYFEKDMIFYKTHDGRFNKAVLLDAVEMIKKYVNAVINLKFFPVSQQFFCCNDVS